MARELACEHTYIQRRGAGHNDPYPKPEDAWLLDEIYDDAGVPVYIWRKRCMMPNCYRQAEHGHVLCVLHLERIATFGRAV